MSEQEIQKEAKEQLIKDLIPDVVKALLTSSSDSGQYAPDQRNVLTQVISLAGQITIEFVNQITAIEEPDDFEEQLAWSFVTGSLSHQADALGMNKDIKEFVSNCIINGKTMATYINGSNLV